MELKMYDMMISITSILQQQKQEALDFLSEDERNVWWKKQF